MAKLHPIAGCEDPNRVADIVFVHGLNPLSGDSQKIAYETWGENFVSRDFWPQWLQDDLKRSENGAFPVGVWLLEYDSAATAFLGPAMESEERAASIFGEFHGRHIGERPLFFICHSLGGLTVKQILCRGANENVNNWSAIVKQVRGVVFLSTPHYGADLPGKLSVFSTFLRLNPTMKELEVNSETSVKLAVCYQGIVERFGIKTLSYHETLKTSGNRVVQSKSGDVAILGIRSTPLSEDHITIARVASRNATVYTGTLRFLREILTELKSPVEPPKTSTGGEALRETPQPATPEPVPTRVEQTTPHIEKPTTPKTEGKVDEGRLIEFLNGLTPASLGQILLMLPETTGRIPDGVGHIARVEALVLYMRSAEGPGMARLAQVVQNKFPTKGPFI